jgi:putative membrane protein
MIVYEPNKHFLSDIGHLAKSWTMVKILRAVFMMGLYTLAVCAAAFYIPQMKTMAMDISIFSFLEIVLSILLVFRTNNSYDRWCFSPSLG